MEVGIPEEHKRHAEDAAEALGDGIWTCMPFVHGAHPREVGSEKRARECVAGRMKDENRRKVGEECW